MSKKEGWYFIEFKTVGDAKRLLPTNVLKRVMFPKIGFYKAKEHLGYINGCPSLGKNCTALVHTNDDVLAILKMTEPECGIAGLYNNSEKENILEDLLYLKQCWNRRRYYDSFVMLALERISRYLQPKITWHNKGEVWL